MHLNIGEKIKSYRINKGYTVNKLANLAGISQSYLRDIELGNKQPTVEYLSYICDALSISLSEFFCDDEKICDELTMVLKKLSTPQKQSLISFIKTII